MAAPFLRSSSRPAGRLMARNSNARVPVRRLPDPQRRGERNLGYLASASTPPARRETPRRGPDLGFPQQLTEADNRAQSGSYRRRRALFPSDGGRYRVRPTSAKSPRRAHARSAGLYPTARSNRSVPDVRRSLWRSKSLTDARRCEKHWRSRNESPLAQPPAPLLVPVLPNQPASGRTRALTSPNLHPASRTGLLDQAYVVSR